MSEADRPLDSVPNTLPNYLPPFGRTWRPYPHPVHNRPHPQPACSHLKSPIPPPPHPPPPSVHLSTYPLMPVPPHQPRTRKPNVATAPLFATTTTSSPRLPPLPMARLQRSRCRAPPPSLQQPLQLPLSQTLNPLLKTPVALRQRSTTRLSSQNHIYRVC